MIASRIRSGYERYHAEVQSTALTLDDLDTPTAPSIIMLFVAFNFLNIYDRTIPALLVFITIH